MTWRPKDGYCCVIGCNNEVTEHYVYCNKCWDAMEDE